METVGRWLRGRWCAWRGYHRWGTAVSHPWSRDQVLQRRECRDCGGAETRLIPLAWQKE